MSENSPEFLKRNKKLIVQTIKRNVSYLDQVPEDILTEELKYTLGSLNTVEEIQQRGEPVLERFLNENSMIYTAFINGYKYRNTTPMILRGEEGKTAILQYLDMKKSGDEIQDFPSLIDPSLLEDEEFRETYIRFLDQKGYNLRRNDPQALLQDSRLVIPYYEKKLERGENINESNIILNPSLIRDSSFMKQYIQMFQQKGISDATILDTLTKSPACVEEIKKNANLFQLIFNNIRGNDIQSFFKTFFTQEELKEFLSRDISWQGEMKRFSDLYRADPTIISTLDGRLLDEKYSFIPQHKMQIFAKQNESVQAKILGLNDLQLKLYQKMTQKISNQTNRWNRFEKNIINNLSGNVFYGDLLSDLYEQSRNGDLITAQEIENLTYLFSRKSLSREDFEGLVGYSYREMGLGPEEIEKGKMKEADIIFPIKTKKELSYLQEIRELVCDTVLSNPELDDEQLTGRIKKYLVAFEDLSPMDRVKLALMEKYYNMSLKEASTLIERFGTDIEHVKTRGYARWTNYRADKSYKKYF